MTGSSGTLAVYSGESANLGLGLGSIGISGFSGAPGLAPLPLIPTKTLRSLGLWSPTELTGGLAYPECRPPPSSSVTDSQGRTLAKLALLSMIPVTFPIKHN